MDFLEQFISIDTPERLARLFQLRTALENLVGVSRATPDDEDNFERINLSRSIPHQLIKNQDTLKQILSSINFRLDEWQQHYSSDIDKILQRQPDLINDFHNGIYTIVGQIYLSNPYNVVKVEKMYNLPITGDRALLMKNWNSKFYGLRCLDYNTSDICLQLAIQNNNVDKFNEIYPLIKDEFDLSELIPMLELAAERGYDQIFATIMKSYMEYDLNQQELQGFDFIKKAQSDIYPLIYEYKEMLPTIPIALDAISRRGDRSTFEYLIKLAPPTSHNLFNIAGGAKRNNWDDLVELALSQLRKQDDAATYLASYNSIFQ